MRWILTFTLIAWMLFFSGCTTRQDPAISFAPPKYVEELPSREEEYELGNAGSLFNQGDSPLYSDRKAMSVNDIVTVVIQETATQNSDRSKSTNYNAALGLGGLNTGYNAEGNAINAAVSGAMNSINGITNIGAELDSSSEFDGSGSQQRQESFTTTVSARVIKILNNGNYFIEGGREILIDGEKQNIRVSGVIRPEDISAANSIDSQYIADAKIMYNTEGQLRKATEKRWGTRLVESIWPF
ncbi:MAG: flagellar basal body L-ring protein FlgH [Campylobacterales bacterium]